MPPPRSYRRPPSCADAEAYPESRCKWRSDPARAWQTNDGPADGEHEYQCARRPERFHPATMSWIVVFGFDVPNHIRRDGLASLGNDETIASRTPGVPPLIV